MTRRDCEIFREIFKNAADGIIVADNRGKIIEANHEFCDLTGYSSNELRSLTVFDLRVESSELVQQDMEDSKRTGHLKRECYARRKDGSIFSIDASISYINSYGGVYYAIVRDITGRKIIQQIHEEFSALIAHDLRAPLTTISLRVRQLKQRHKDAKDLEIISTIESNCTRMNEMISEISRSAKLESGKFQDAGKHPVDLNTVLAEIITQDIPPDKQKRIRYFSEENLRINGDENHLKRAFINLITNSLKYSPRDKIVEILLKKGKNSAHVTIKDYGEGISSEDIPYIFDQFYRSKRAEGKYGLGLGLYITKSIVEDHDGSIGVESRPGAGSTFSVSLPLSKAE